MAQGLLPGRTGSMGVTAKDNRNFVNGVLWVLRSGAHWKHLPGNRKSAHARFTRWGETGVWKRIFHVSLTDPNNTYSMIDFHIVRAHQQAAWGKGGAKARLWGVPEED